MKKLWESCDYL